MSYLTILRARIVALTESGFPPIRVQLSAEQWAAIKAAHRKRYGGAHELTGLEVLGAPVDVRPGRPSGVIIWSGGAEEVAEPSASSSPK